MLVELAPGESMSILAQPATQSRSAANAIATVPRWGAENSASVSMAFSGGAFARVQSSGYGEHSQSLQPANVHLIWQRQPSPHQSPKPQPVAAYASRGRSG